MLPTLFTEKMKALLADEYDNFLLGYEKEEFHGLRENPLKSQEDAFTRTKKNWQLKAIPWCPTGYYYEQELRPGKHPFHEAGVYYIQEPSAMTPGEMLDVRPGQYVLDLCSAPGGKATQIAGKLMGQGLLIANEIIPSRARILSENIERMGVRNAIVTNEDPDSLAEHFPEYFDRIMVDAPCSGEGMFRKNTDATGEWSVENVEICYKRQDDILDAAALMLAPGGRMVYSTCTFSPEENEGSIQHFLDTHKDYHLLAAPKCDGMADGRAEWAYFGARSTVTEESGKTEDSLSTLTNAKVGSSDLSGTIRLWPHMIDGEGHYTAILEKDGNPTPREERMPDKKLEKGVKEKTLGDYLAFSKDYLNVSFEGTYLTFGENLYLSDARTPSLKGLKVLRPGLHLGSLLKGRFEPSHALALALNPSEFKQRMDLDLETAKRFIAGEGLPCDASLKGWVLVTVEGYSLGFGKASGGQLKNHYPKGLRKNL